MKRSSFFAGTAAVMLLAVVAAAQPAAPRHPAPRRPAFDTRALWLQAPPNPDSVRHDSIRVVRRDSAFVDSTSRDSLKHPHPTPPPRRRPQPQRPRPRIVYYG